GQARPGEPQPDGRLVARYLRDPLARERRIPGRRGHPRIRQQISRRERPRGPNPDVESELDSAIPNAADVFALARDERGGGREGDVPDGVAQVGPEEIRPGENASAGGLVAN